MTYKTNVVTGSVLSIFSVLYLYFSFSIKPFKGIGATPLDSTFIPRLWGTCLLILSASLILRGFKEKRKAGESGKRAATVPPSLKSAIANNAEVVQTFFAILVFTALLGPVGFTIMSALFIFFEALVLTPKAKRNPAAAAAIAVIAAVSIDFLFVRLLSVLLPKGILGF